MKRASLLVCAAGGMLFLMTGCTLTELFLASHSDPVSGERVVVGSVEEVAVSMSKSLQRLKMTVYSDKTAAGLVVGGQTRTGARFEFLLTREQTTTQGERTRVRMRWVDGRDDQAHVQILAEMDKEQKRS